MAHDGLAHRQQVNPNNLPLCPKDLSDFYHNCFGSFYTVEGDLYAGEFKNNLYDGQGTYTWSNGDQYIGDFKQALREGNGSLIFADGERYVGEFKSNKMHGLGMKTLVDGSWYYGEWKGSVLHGKGIMFFAPSGERKQGIWENGKYMRHETVNLPPLKDGSSLAAIQAPESKSGSTSKTGNEPVSDVFVIRPIFAWVGEFEESLAPVKMIDSSKYGFIDKNGKMIIAPQFDEASSFQEGLAKVRVGNRETGKFGYIDKSGNMVIPPRFDFAHSFKDGLAVVQIKNGQTRKYGYIDKQGKFVVSPQFDEAMDFSEGLAAVLIGNFETGKWGFIDKLGKMVVKPQFFAYLSKFSEGLAPVRFGDEKTGKYGFIDKQGKVKISARYSFASYFKDGVAPVLVGVEGTEKYGYIDKDGNIVIKPQFDSAALFVEGLALVRVGDEKTGKYGFIDKQGNFLVKPQYDDANGFAEGLAAVKIGDNKTGRWGYIDKQGRMVISTVFDNSWQFSPDLFILSRSFSAGVAPGCIRENLVRKCGFISKSGAKPYNFSIDANSTVPDVNGVVIIMVRTNSDTASLKINGEEQGGKPDGNYSIKRVARVGQDTQFTITAVDVYGNSDSKTITVTRQPAPTPDTPIALKPEAIKRAPARDAVAIIIGIQDYKRVPKAEFANNDAKEFYEYAIRALGIKQEKIKMLLDDEADEVNIVKAFENWLPIQVNKDKTDVYVFYSGHGLPAPDGKSLYFLPHGVDKELLSRTAVGQNEIVAALSAAKPKSVTMFIDACYSGQTRGGDVLVANAKPVSLKSDTNAYPPNFTVITASANDQISSSSAELKHGIFSFYLMKGMEGEADTNKDGKITVGEMQDYLSDKVSRQAMTLNRKQTTQLVGDTARVLIGR